MNSSNSQPRWVKPCRYCGQNITFDPDIRSASGTLIPVELTDTRERHRCGNSRYQRELNSLEGKTNPKQTEQQPTSNELGLYFGDEYRVLQAQEFLDGINRMLTGSFELVLQRKPRESKR